MSLTCLPTAILRKKESDFKRIIDLLMSIFILHQADIVGSWYWDMPWWRQRYAGADWQCGRPSLVWPGHSHFNNHAVCCSHTDSHRSNSWESTSWVLPQRIWHVLCVWVMSILMFLLYTQSWLLFSSTCASSINADAMLTGVIWSKIKDS